MQPGNRRLLFSRRDGRLFPSNEERSDLYYLDISFFFMVNDDFLGLSDKLIGAGESNKPSISVNFPVTYRDILAADALIARSGWDYDNPDYRKLFGPNDLDLPILPLDRFWECYKEVVELPDDKLFDRIVAKRRNTFLRVALYFLKHFWLRAVRLMEPFYRIPTIGSFCKFSTVFADKFFTDFHRHRFLILEGRRIVFLMAVRDSFTRTLFQDARCFRDRNYFYYIPRQMAYVMSKEDPILNCCLTRSFSQ